MRQVREEELVGKTIKSIENEAVNVLKLIFTDGTTLELEADQAVCTSFGSIPGIFVSEPQVDASETVADKSW
jgi:hypothetical protein